MSINTRISLVIRELGLNNNSFAKAIGVSPTVTFNVISGRNTKPSYDLLEKIVFTFDNLNTEWLLRGKGSMFLNNTITQSRNTSVIKPKHTEIKELNTKNEANSVEFLQQQLVEMTVLNKNLTQIMLNMSIGRENDLSTTAKAPKIPLPKRRL